MINQIYTTLSNHIQQIITDNSYDFDLLDWDGALSNNSNEVYIAYGGFNASDTTDTLQLPEFSMVENHNFNIVFRSVSNEHLQQEDFLEFIEKVKNSLNFSLFSSIDEVKKAYVNVGNYDLERNDSHRGAVVFILSLFIETIRNNN